ncbi:Galactosyltransferase Lgt5 [Sulfitobacter noctilucae]|uniref:hypothetical protein n=1 Tax=Sulfitobacter noctilucae TaxID=1342302 RepID=UPI00046A22A2|nr:hypothetical protein [Sulfitobacter noctilucae]KIN70654.1 Galactosyltransferase Lgt5 [Sulfitobacter noctilucae]
MARLREVGTLWIGGPLSWMEQLCLKSFVDKGQKITLFSYEDIPNVPDGVIRRDGREIIDTDDFIKYEKKDSFALFADWFRLHMIQQCPGMIWVDTDVYCHRAMDYDSDYVFGFELPGEHRVNNAVLGMPSNSELLQQMIEFTNDRFSIAPFLPKKRQEKLRQMAAKGKPVHISEQPWGVWGPMMVTYFVHHLKLEKYVQPLDAFYPITFRERTKFMRRVGRASELISDATTALHLWASNKRQLGNIHDGLPPEGSYLELLVNKHEINPHLAPIKGRGKTNFDGGLIDEVDIEEVSTVADISGHGRSFVLALYHKFDCDIHLVNTDKRGEIRDDDEEWLAEYITFLKDHDVDEDRIKVIRKAENLKPVDILCNLNGFGDIYKVPLFAKFLDNMMHSDTRVFMDVRKGSGAFPFIRTYGTNTHLSDREEDGKNIARVRLQPKPPEPLDDAEDTWADIAGELAGKDGWYRPGTNGHSFLYMPRSADTLVVTFDNLDIAMTKRDDRRPWGYSFIKAQGWSMLSVLSGGWTWYREQWVSDQFDQLKSEGFFKQFKRVVFYGASMGGYAACAFSPAAPGCDVVAISPQSTLDKTIVPWESRYKVAWDNDYTGPYGDAAEVSKAARRVYILYDPYEPLDAGHAMRFTNENIQHLRAPLLGHRLGSSLNQMGILTPIVLGALTGTLTSHDYYQLLRTRKESPRYQRELFKRAVKTGHKDLARSLGAFILEKNPNRAISKGMKELG